MNQLAGTLLITAFFVIQVGLGKTQILDSKSEISGTWRGNSECVVKNESCHDETNVYRFSEDTAQRDWFSGTGSKVVNGKEVPMGTLKWQYDGKSHILESKNPNGVFRFVVGHDTMEGTLLLGGVKVYRRIHLAKVK